MENIQHLTAAEIIAAVPAQTFTYSATRNKKKLIEEASLLSEDLRSMIQAAGDRKLQKKGSKNQNHEVKDQRTETQRDRREQKRSSDNLHETSEFMETVTEEERRYRHKCFLEATSDASLEQRVCFACARELWKKEGAVIPIEEVPNFEKLRPTAAHPAHDLLDGKLILRGALEGEGAEACGFLCFQCLEALKRHKKPQLSLANGMWVGDVPDVLSTLTMPEQLLIALHYPRCFVFKLYPRSGHAADASHLQSGIRGNVTSYEHNIHDVALMLEGKLLPRPMQHLASVLAVAFIGKGKLKPGWLKQTFRVRRRRVVAALCWLKENNRHYSDVQIDAQRVEELPLDDVPKEIVSSIRQDEADGVAEREREGYAPEDDDEERETDSGSAFSDSESENNVDQASDDKADVIPLQHLGCAETDLSNVSTNELMMYGLANLEKDAVTEGGYAARHSRVPVSDYGFAQKGKEEEQSDRRNPMEASFPCLYPYGQGGMEQEREEDVSFGAHIRWSLQYYDRRFRKHHSFPFVAFGIQQKRRALGSARVQMLRKNFTQVATIWSTITLDDLKKAAGEEEKNIPISDARVRLLFKHVRVTAGRVMGSDQSRKSYRSQIWGTIIDKGPPSLWVTINPNDVHNPIAQVLTGESISMDSFDPLAGPSADQRARNIAADPYAAALFFNFIIHTILAELLGIDATGGYKLKVQKGVLGRLSAYFGVVEAQGRGTLHLHAFLWLENAPNGDEMRERLKSDEFRERVQAYIDSNIRAHLDGFDEDGIKAIKRESTAGYSRPPHPDHPDYERLRDEHERTLVRSQQVHTCKKNVCLRVNARGQWECKRGAPWKTADKTVVIETGELTVKRTYGYLNNWSPDILVAGGLNCDLKFLTNGSDTQNITFYTANYKTKAQQKSHNMSALLAAHLPYHMADTKYQENLNERHRLLLYRCLSILNRGAEYSGAQVVSYLMGWNDAFRSHHYVPVYWSAIVGELLRAYPNLKRTKEEEPEPNLDPTHETQEEKNNDARKEGDAQDEEEAEETVVISIGSSDNFVACSQVLDYKFRGSELEDYSFLDMMKNTYDSLIPKKEREKASDSENVQGPERAGPVRGRPRNLRVKYLAEHPKAEVTYRMVRTRGHNTIINFVGSSFPRRDQPDTRDFYCASMLALLKPWREVANMKEPAQSWDEAFRNFLATAPKEVHDTISNIQYYYDSISSAERHHRDNESQDQTPPQKRRRMNEDEMELDGPEDEVFQLTEADVERALALQGNQHEENHGREAVGLARLSNFFRHNMDTWRVVQTSAYSATGDDLLKLQRWQTKIHSLEKDRKELSEDHDIGEITLLSDQREAAEVEYIATDDLACQEALTPLDVSNLLDDQRRAYEIVEWHLNERLSGRDPPQLLMLLYGEGGTGKSKVIQTITKLFHQKGVPEQLVKGAYTGIAASLIDGSTLHKLAIIRAGGDSKSGSEISQEVMRLLKELWEMKGCLVLDEISMVSRVFLALISERISKAKGHHVENGKVFGGMSVILAGDFHQFPPVMTGPKAPLYVPNRPDKDTPEEMMGRAIYEQFTTVVVLKQQVRVTDERWTLLLRNLRHGACTEDDIQVLKSLIIDGTTDLSGEEWKDAVLVTPRHAVRRHWNRAALERHCQSSGEQMFICPAEDTMGGKTLTLQERWLMEVQLAKGGARRRKPFPREVLLAVGMRTMVTWNVQTELDVANGARGTVTKIVLDSREDPDRQDPIIKLKYPPAYVLVKLDRTKASKLEGLDEGVVPITPMKRSITFQMDGHKRTVQRNQLPITEAYAFTDYRSQGQTLPRVIVDIAKPPTGTLTPFHIYVALSRGKGRDSIRLLRGFQEELFTQHPSEFLRKEDARLERLNNETKIWWDTRKREMGRNEAEGGVFIP